jgi:hypothetical protein
MNLADLKKPFDPERVSWRVGSTTQDKSKGMMLAYIDARDVQDRLDDVCGVENWQCRYSLQDKTTICEIGVKIGDEWVFKADGAGATDVEAEKGQLSDSFKRAAVKWGIGRYLYDIDSPWVEVEPAGRSVKMKASEKPKLIAALRRVGQPPTHQPDPPKDAESKTTKPPASTPPKPSGDEAKDKAKDWARRAIVTVKGMRGRADDFNVWYTEAIRGAIGRLDAVDPKLKAELVQEISDTLDSINPVGVL